MKAATPNILLSSESEAESDDSSDDFHDIKYILLDGGKEYLSKMNKLVDSEDSSDEDWLEQTVLKMAQQKGEYTYVLESWVLTVI